MSIHVGIDVGSVSIKAALFTTASEDAHFFERLASEGGFQRVRTLTDAHGRPAWLAVAPYVRIVGVPSVQARAALESLISVIDRSALGHVVGTGSGAGMLEQEFGIERTSDFRVLTRAVETLLPSVRTLFEIGGESSTFVRFERHGPNGRLGIAEYQANGDCAAGTGAFLDQQAGRLRLNIDDAGRIALGARRAAQIAGRCSVFAKSDMIHAQQKGFTPEEILNGLCDAVARNFRSSITKGRAIEPDTACVGGVAANGGVIRALDAAFGWAPGTVIVPPEHASFGAIGAAVLAHDTAGGSGRVLPQVVLGQPAARSQPFPVAPRLVMDNVLLLRDRLTAVPAAAGEGQVDAYLGLDIGSVSTNLVVIDAEGRILKEIYLRTDGRPIEAVRTGLREIERAIGGRIRIRGVGTTGSGRELIAELVGADTVKDEITAHTTGATVADQTLLGLGVDTVFEIGGQDAKFIRLENGIVVDFAMNEACAAGTGSFLEERAQELGIRIDGEFAALALASEAPIRLGERCTVFMERDVNDCLRRGAALADVVAGLAYSVATNYINRVVRGRKIGDVVFFQGGTAYNDAVAAALSAITGKRIIVPPFNGVIGALGVAHLAREKMREGGDSSFRGFTLDKIDYQTFEFTCRGCANYCQMQRFTVDGEHTYWGDKCSERYRKAVRTDREPVIQDLVAFRQSRLLDGYDPDAGAGPVVGLPYCMSTYEWAPFWFAMFRQLGIRVRLSDPTTNDIVKLGLESTVSEPCFPVQVAHGHVRSLLEGGADFVLVPNGIAAPGEPDEKPSYFCPWSQTLPFVTRAAPHIFDARHRLIAPTLWFNAGVKPVAASVREALTACGLRHPASRVEKAVHAGFEAQAAFRASLVEAGSRAMAVLDERNEPAVVVLGRPYNIYDKNISLDVATKLRRYYGINVLGFDCIAPEEDDLRRYKETMFWSYGARLLATAAFVRRRPHLHVIYITNFKCAPDSYVKHYVAGASGRPFLTLQFDGHNNDAGVLTRCEAYLESKGVLGG
jgi:predicted CoA-substrate-specific enzyme activase